ncbi:hypothetical protein PRIPAC_89858 [Pristionchus pacificus]|uniref:RING-type domain-containing protein n=1 Tax=Pristionchus pacificus TaxID=54126 RepID=A0A2A6CXL9_PRIPA|nr:hypothetical protein PRIPAC_89858 [Pristionchus pacificus]|eukprot:PDM82878.1 hypothetical protein PRIPAC_37271 [Pristionchus pacificus]
MGNILTITLDVLTLAQLPPDIIRKIIKMHLGERMDIWRLVGKTWTHLIDEHYNALPEINQMLINVDKDDVTVAIEVSEKDRKHFEPLLYSPRQFKDGPNENRKEAGGILTAARKDGKKYAYGMWENSEQVIIKEDEFPSKLTLDCLVGNVNSVESQVSVMNGVVTLIVKLEDGRYFATAELPKMKAAPPASIGRGVKIDVSQTIELCEDKVSASGNDLDDLAEQCCCAICSEIFDSAKNIPRVLDCGHTFCEICLYHERLCVININVQGKVLPVNYTIIGMAEQLMKTRADPKVMCKQCKTNHPTTAVRLCMKKDCNMFNQLLCFNCVIDGDHGGHSIKYDVRLEKKLSKAAIPPNVLGQIDTIKSVQEVKEYQEIVNDLTNVLMKECDALEEEFDRKVNIKSLS